MRTRVEGRDVKVLNRVLWRPLPVFYQLCGQLAKVTVEECE